MILCHAFAHCGDPRGDLVDKAAKAARDTNIRVGEAWPYDVARITANTATTRMIAQLEQDRTSFHKRMLKKLENWHPTVARVPPIPLRRKQAALILQLRTGYWPSLGAHTFIRSAYCEFPCRLCREMISPESGGAVAHIFTCSVALRKTRICPEDLWSAMPSVLRRVIKHAKDFVVTSRALSTSSDGSDTRPKADKGIFDDVHDIRRSVEDTGGGATGHPIHLRCAGLMD